MNMTVKEYANIDLIDQETMNMLQEYSKGNPELVTDIIDSFVPEAEELIGKIQNAIQSQDLELLRSSVHSLSGISGSIGASQLRALASDSENAAKKGEQEKAISLATQIPDAYQELLNLLKKL
ncbi:MAG: Hpt domain-containing protein [Bacteroidales bacterium]